MRAQLMIGLLLTGCATVERAPPVANAIAALPSAFAGLYTAQTSGDPIADLLPRDDPAYLALSGKAFASGPTLAAAMARVDAARAELRGSRAEQMPDVSAAASGTRERINPVAQFGGPLPPGVAILSSRSSFRVGIDASWDADLFGRLRASARAAEARLDAATADAAGVRLALATDIAGSVIDVRAIDARAVVLHRDLTQANDLVGLTQARSAAGIAPTFDLLRAQSLALAVRGQLAALSADRAAVIGRLVTLTATSAQELEAALMQPAAPAVAVLPVLAIPSTQLRQRPDVVAADQRLTAADHEIAAAAADRFPRLSITAAMGLFALAAGDLFSDDAIIGSLGAGVAGPLLDFGRVRARIGQRQADAREAFAVYRQTLFTALGEVESALGSVAAADSREAALTAQARIDVDAASLAQDRYSRGLETFLAVIDAQRSANGSQAAAVDAAAISRQARVALYRAVGGAEIGPTFAVTAAPQLPPQPLRLSASPVLPVASQR
jgi:NodT family efflux transporter outer membrane factor (OMF) lipoprotein